MDRLEFRIWDKQKKKMYYSDWQEYFISPLGHVIHLEDGKLIEYTNRFVVMMDTKITDDTGEAVFEGDILRIKIGKDWQSPLEVVLYDTGCVLPFCDWRDGFCGMTELEIVGNVFQNPKLLKKINKREEVVDFLNNILNK